MYKLVVSDMDETFVAEHCIPEANIDALRRIRERGALFVPSSGRPYASIMDNFADIDQSLMEGSYVVSYNGGFINRYGDPTPIVSFAMDEDFVRDLYRYARKEGICQHVYTTSGRIFVCDAPQEEHEHLSRLSGVSFLSTASYDDPSFTEGESVAKMIFLNTDFDALHVLGAKLAPEVEQRGYTVTYSSNRYLEFIPSDINKGTGLAKLAELIGIDLSETIGVGDSANDIEMIKTAGLGVGVANVTDEVRPFCDVVLDTKADDGAFAELVDRFLES